MTLMMMMLRKNWKTIWIQTCETAGTIIQIITTSFYIIVSDANNDDDETDQKTDNEEIMKKLMKTSQQMMKIYSQNTVNDDSAISQSQIESNIENDGSSEIEESSKDYETVLEKLAKVMNVFKKSEIKYINGLHV